MKRQSPRDQSEAEGCDTQNEAPPGVPPEKKYHPNPSFFKLKQHRITHIEGLQLKPLEPLGLLIHPAESGAAAESIPSISGELVRLLCYQYGFVVLRGWKILDDDGLFEFASRIGEPVIWKHGPILHLQPSKDPQNMVMSYEALPIHWDLMFPPQYLESKNYKDFTASFQIFQCAEAGSKEEGGATTFFDGRLILESQDGHTIDDWKNTRLSYFTPQSYFGGKTMTYPMIMQHPQTGDSILRYHPPWNSSIQQVTVSSAEKSSEQLDQLIKNMQEILFDPRWYLEYYWTKGDLLVADNHYLLHGRTEMLSKTTQRHLLRIQVLHRDLSGTTDGHVDVE